MVTLLFSSFRSTETVESLTFAPPIPHTLYFIVKGLYKVMYLPYFITLYNPFNLVPSLTCDMLEMGKQQNDNLLYYLWRFPI